MTDWREAETGNQPEAPTLATDDLVLWLGEAVVNEKQQRRIATYQQQKIQALENEIFKIKSVAMGDNTKAAEAFTAENDKLKAEIVGLTASLEAARNVQHARIVQLEEQVHTIALERDEARSEVAALKQLAEIKPKPVKKG